jgi:hypothetical protein
LNDSGSEAERKARGNEGTAMNNEHPPDYILAIPREGEVPEVMASCDKEDLEELKDLKLRGWYLYKRIGRVLR